MSDIDGQNTHRRMATKGLVGAEAFEFLEADVDFALQYDPVTNP